MMEEPVDGRGGEGLGHQLIEGSGMEVRRERDGAFLVGGIDQSVQALGGVGSHREQADVVDLCGHPHSWTYADTATMPRILRFGPRGRDASGLVPRRLGVRVGIVPR